MTYLPADYTKVDEAIAKANALNKDNYKDFSAVETAVNAVVRDKNITEQSEVDAMTKAIEDAIAALQYKDADYTKVDAAIAKANALNKNDYKDFSGVETAVKAVVRDKNITEQSEVDAMAKAIEDAIAALQYKDADYTRVDAAIARANALNKNDYKDFSGVECAIRAVARGKNITQQAEVDAMAKAIEDALAALQYKDANKTTQPTPAPAATATPQYTIPQTGDTSNPALLVVLMLVSGSAAIGTAVVASKRKNNRYLNSPLAPSSGQSKSAAAMWRFSIATKQQIAGFPTIVKPLISNKNVQNRPESEQFREMMGVFLFSKVNLQKQARARR